ncbi:MAG: UbiX family flavin prenyltransferase [Bacteroidetes bacterium]|nr:UbiX family flavin prenyltransferase [Bacteroidota bacterium]
MQEKNKIKIAVGVTGASGAVYAKVLLDKLWALQTQLSEVGVVFTENAKQVWEYELGNDTYKHIPFISYQTNDFNAPFASGSANYDALIICPCTMGTLGRIASGTANDLLCRAADVMLKERKKLILVCRETPLNLIHINNMKTVTEAGGIICPATPSFYSKPESIEDVAATVIDRVLQLCGIEQESYRWGEGSN